EFFQLTRQRLTDTGVLVINVGRSPDNRSLIDALVSTLLEVYPSVHVMDIPYTFNSMVYATVQTTSMDDLAANFSHLAQSGDAHPLLIESISKVLSFRQPLPERTIVFTDDHAPVEWIINRMVLEYVFSGDYEELQ
ncbi:MAG: hypothetical protein OEZ02_14520, partial [Anaerolineae bacterium]|nr:hypothetical protein [Anaerolineae bacterium]